VMNDASLELMYGTMLASDDSPPAFCASFTQKSLTTCVRHLDSL